VTPALAAKRLAEPTAEPAEESFDAFLARSVRRAPILVGLAIAFLLIRALGARAGAVLLIAGSTVALPLTVLRPEIGLYALVLNFVNEWDSYYHLQSYLPISLPVLFDGAIALGILLQRAGKTRQSGLRSAQVILIGLYVALVTVSVIASDSDVPNLWASFRTGFLIRPIIFLFVIILVHEPKQLHRLLLALLVAHLFLMATGLSDVAQKGASALYRVRGTVTAINYLAYVCVVTISIVIALLVYARDRLSRYLLLGLAVVTVIVCLRTLSRSGFFAFAGTLVFLGFRFARSPRALFVSLGFAVLFYALTPAGLTQRLEEVQDLRRTDRYHLSRVALRMALDHPVLGVGWQAYEDRFLAYDYEHIFYKKKAPHSLYLAIAAGSGFPALAAYLAAFGITLVELFRVERLYRRREQGRAFGACLAIGLQAGLVGHFVFGLAGSYGDSYYAFFVLALSLVVIRHHRRDGAELLR
jgi:O-antigen ligase